MFCTDSRRGLCRTMIKNYLSSLFLLLLLFLSACQEGGDLKEKEEKPDNVKVRKEDLGDISFGEGGGGYHFGSQLLGTELIKEIRLTNTGKLGVREINVVFPERDDNSAFSFSGEKGLFPGERGTCRSEKELKVGEFCTIEIRFLPKIQRLEEITVNVFYNNGIASEKISFKLTGYGGEEALFTTSVAVIDFGLMDKPSESFVREVEFQNIGGQIARDIDFSILDEAEGDTGDYRVNSFEVLPNGTTCSKGADIPINGKCSVRFRFFHPETAPYHDYGNSLTMSFRYGPGEEVKKKSVRLTARVLSLEGVLQYNAAKVVFPEVTNFNKSKAEILVKNVGHKPMTLVSATLSGTYDSVRLHLDNCLNIDNDQKDSLGRLIVPQDESCRLKLELSPELNSLPVDFSDAKLSISYDNHKSPSLITSDELKIEALVRSPAKLEFQGMSLPYRVDFQELALITDPRYRTARRLNLVNLGETPARGVSFLQTEAGKNPYGIFETQCGEIIFPGENCRVNLVMAPMFSIYQGLPLPRRTDLNLNFGVAYKNGSLNNGGEEEEKVLTVSTTGQVISKSRLVIHNEKRSESASGVMAGVETEFRYIIIKNVGTKETNDFSLIFSETEHFSLDSISEDFPGINELGGQTVLNCQKIDSKKGGSTRFLESNQVCYYRIVMNSSGPGSFNNFIELKYSDGYPAGAGQEIIGGSFELAVEYIWPGYMNITNLIPVERTFAYRYPDFTYPGEGNQAPIGDLEKIFGRFTQELPLIKLRTPDIPASTTVDYAYWQLGYGHVNRENLRQFTFENVGQHYFKFKEIKVTEVFDTTSGTPVDVTGENIVKLYRKSYGDGFFPIDCFHTTYPISRIGRYERGQGCSLQLTIISNITRKFKGRIRIKYENGHLSSSGGLQEFTSYIDFQGEIYDPSQFGKLEMVAPVEHTASRNIPLDVIWESNESVISTVKIQSTSANHEVRDVFFSIKKGGPYDILRDTDLQSESFSRITLPELAHAYQVVPSKCQSYTPETRSLAASIGICNLDFLFSPSKQGMEFYTVRVWYDNGKTYERLQFHIRTWAKKPAKLEFQGLTKSQTEELYYHNFKVQVVGGTYDYYAELSNTGEVPTTSISFPTQTTSFGLENSTHSDYPSCPQELPPGGKCYARLLYIPQYSDLEVEKNGTIRLDYHNSLPASTGEHLRNLSIQMTGFAEEKHSLHKGWAKIKAVGYNPDYARELQFQNKRKDDGSFYGADELSYVKLSWEPMGDLEVTANPIDGYLIYKNTGPSYRIHKDTPYAVIGRDENGEVISEFVDKNPKNTPGKIWYYYIIPTRNGKKSRIPLGSQPYGHLRVVMPSPYMALAHRYILSKEVCRDLGIDLNDQSRFHLDSHGCFYISENFSSKHLKFDSDLLVDLYEVSEDYFNNPKTEPHNRQGKKVVKLTFDEAKNLCQQKQVDIDGGGTPGFGSPLKKRLMTRKEYFALAKGAADFDPAFCSSSPTNRMTGSNSDCLSHYGAEYMVGGYPEWSTTQMDGFGVGERTNFGVVDSEYQNFNFKTLYDPIGKGYLSLNYNMTPAEDRLEDLCMDQVQGTPVLKTGASCQGDRLKEIVSYPSSSPNHVSMTSQPVNTAFTILHLDNDIWSTRGWTINATNGGGVTSSSVVPDNFSRYQVRFLHSENKEAGARCIMSLP